MTLLEIMERSGNKNPALVKAWVKDAINILKSGNFEEMRENKQNIIDGQREYILPADVIAVKSISVKDTNDKKYKKIRRLSSESIVREDTDPE
jgi:hypothetical protein